MGIRDEFLFDFSMNLPRVLISGKTGILDHVKKIVLISEENIVVDCGSLYLALTGESLIVDQLEEQRMQVSGEIRRVEFYQREKTGKADEQMEKGEPGRQAGRRENT